MAPGPRESRSSEVDELAKRFADDVLAAFATLRLDDVLALFAGTGRAATRTAPGRTALKGSRGASSASSRSERPNRAATLGRIVAALAPFSEGVRAEELRKQLGLDKPAFAQAIRDGLSTGELRKEGKLRSTRYIPGHVGNGGGIGPRNGEPVASFSNDAAVTAAEAGQGSVKHL